MTLTDWATRWAIPPQAMAELANGCMPDLPPPVRVVTSESAVQSLVRLEAAAKRIHLWRNNVGVLLDRDERPVRYGLANDSAKVNAVVKSGDLIGIQQVLITDAHVGKVLGQFVSRECKAPDWVYSGSPHEQAQLRWATLINSYGGDAAIVNSEGSFR